MWRHFSQSSGSCLRTHRIFPAVKPGRAGLAVMASSFSRPSVSVISSHSPWVRPSHQRMAGRITWP